MATTKIWAIKDSLSRVLDYASNPKKTAYTDLQKVLHYAENGAKTHGEESTCYVTGVNCCAETAFSEMLSVQRRFGKTGGNVAYHAYQSFKTGEVTPYAERRKTPRKRIDPNEGQERNGIQPVCQNL